MTGKNVFFDDCFRYAGDLVDGDMKTGDLVEAKGEEYGFLLPQICSKAMEKNVEKAKNQLDAADAAGVRLKWYFAEKDAADATRERFKNVGLERITIGYMPLRRRR